MDILFRPGCTQIHLSNAAALHELLEEYRQNQRSGLLQFNAGAGQDLALTLAHGKITNVYRRSEQGCEQYQDEQWLKIATTLQACTAFNIILSPQSVRLAKILLEHCQFGKEQILETINLYGWLALLAPHPTPSALHIRWEGAELAFILPGNNRDPRVTLWTGKELKEGKTLAALLKNWDESFCYVKRSSAVTETNAWLEYSQHFAFSELIWRLLQRYALLSGQGLAQTICNDTSLNAAKRGWNISLVDQAVRDEGVFNNPEAAAFVYRSLTNLVIHHIHAVLGRMLLSSILQEILRELDAQSRRMVQQFAFLPAFALYPENKGEPR